MSPKPPDTKNIVAGTYLELARPEKLGVVLSPLKIRDDPADTYRYQPRF